MRVHSLLTVVAGFFRGHSRRVPMVSSMTGSRVVETATLMRAMSSPARPMLRRKGTEVSASAAKLTATVIPENNTECPAVRAAVSTASEMARPFERSSLQRVTMRSE